jgi:hypothetical protein
MGGKAALILVLGFSAMVMIVGLNLNNISGSAVDNSTSYFENSVAKEIAKSGINFAISNLSRNHNWDAPGSPYSYNGTDNLDITVIDSGRIKIITAMGHNEGKNKLVEVKVNMASFSEFAYFSHQEAPTGQKIWWGGMDSVWGPFHTNDIFRVWKHPYFNSRVSHGGPIEFFTNSASDAPIIKGSYSTSITIPLPTDGVANLAVYAASGGHTFSGQSSVFMKFVGDSIKYKFNAGDPYTTVLGTDLAPNGIVYVHNGNLRLEGTVKGKWSVGSNQSVYLDNDIIYSDVPNPKDENDPSQDLLGIVAMDNVLVTDNTANHSDINIHAAIYCETGGFEAENFKTRPLSGDIHLIGGITQNIRSGVASGFVNGSGKIILKSGFNKDYKYDSRLMKLVPPYFPSTKIFKVVSWLE